MSDEPHRDDEPPAAVTGLQALFGKLAEIMLALFATLFAGLVRAFGEAFGRVAHGDPPKDERRDE